MANTLKFGNKNWATKDGSILAYNSENNNYKPLPFNFERDSTATVVGKDGLIKTVGSGEPRIDYKDNTDGALKLEPTRTNLVTYSEDFSNAAWAKSNVSITINSTTSPDGLLNGSLMTITGGTSDQRISDDVTYSGTNVFSVFAKANDSKWLSLRIGSIANKWFDLENGVLGGSTIATGLVDSFIEDFGNGWYRCGIIFTDSSTTNTRIYPAENDLDITHTSGSVYVYGAQAESSSSYATSIIKTQGSAVTRLADSCSQTPPDGVIGQTEGTIFVDVDFKTLSDTNMFVSIRPDSNNKIEIYRSDAIIYGEFVITNSFNFNKTNVTVGRYKIAVAYSSGSSAMYINGVLIGSNTTTFAFTSTLDSIYINSRGTSFIEQSNYNDLKLYNTRLSNAELAALTQV